MGKRAEAMSGPIVTATQEINRLFALMRENRFDRADFREVAEARLAAWCHKRIQGGLDENQIKVMQRSIKAWESALEDINNGVTRESDVGEPDDPSVECETP